MVFRKEMTLTIADVLAHDYKFKVTLGNAVQRKFRLRETLSQKEKKKAFSTWRK